MKRLFFLIALVLVLTVIEVWAQAINTTQTLPDGRVLKVKSYGDLILGPDRLLSNAMVQAKGQFAQNTKNGTIIASSNTVVSISSGEISLDSEGNVIEFRITKDTKLCDKEKAIQWKDINVGDVVTVVTSTANNYAMTIKIGPMLIGGLPPFNKETVLLNYGCEMDSR